MGVGSSTHVPLSSVRPLGQVQTGPLGLSRHSHSHFFLSQGLVTDRDTERELRIITAFVSVSSESFVCFLLTLRLLVAMVQNYIRGMVHSNCQVLNRAFTKLIHSEDVVVDVGNAIDVVFKDIDAEGVMELCVKTERACYRNTDSIVLDRPHKIATEF